MVRVTISIIIISKEGWAVLFGTAFQSDLGIVNLTIPMLLTVSRFSSLCGRLALKSLEHLYFLHSDS